MRLAVARDDGLLEGTIGEVVDRDTEHLVPEHRAALGLADALMTRPGDLADTDVAALRSHFTNEQLVELVLDTMKWNYQKVAVALGTDDEVVPGELTDLHFDDDGHWMRPS